MHVLGCAHCIVWTGYVELFAKHGVALAGHGGWGGGHIEPMISPRWPS